MLRSIAKLNSPAHWPLCITLLLSISIGCSSSLSRRLLHNETNDKKSANQSSISQLGSALPAMKPGDDRELAMITAKQMAIRGYYDEAVELYRQAETMAPKMPKLDAELAPALAGSGQYQESLTRYRRLLKSQQKDVALRTNFGWTLMESGDLTGAEKELRMAIDHDAAYQPAKINLGIVIAKQKRYEEALAVLRPTIGEGAAYHNVAVIAIDNGDESYAKKSLQQASHCPDVGERSSQLLQALNAEAVVSLN